ncbi:DUF971 domain-containing protein [Schlegelella sp. S2-27]|uniref:DUF971 domain-containing protein n=1 Tax=Caldimonas mangrovi TaxID=2944811 RepID=A0ABT0YIX1_9BURK|nr:DUF971 domain-containing protein [Caldimonas mangrovi]MCM5678667.1 DUF971 domain-containing protein [Caldimonas mangrovi]
MSCAPTHAVWHQASGAVELAWSDGARAVLSGAALRSACRCAGCERVRRSGGRVDAPVAVRVVDLRPMGEGAVQICFSDGHERGVYPWVYLRDLVHEAIA